MKKKNGFLFYSLLIIGMLLMYTNSCKKNDPQVATPKIITVPISEIAGASVICGGNVTSQGGTPVIQHGLCWSKYSDATIYDDITTNGSGTGSFTDTIYGLEPNTTYYIRAYATNDEGTAYGSEIKFTTGELVLPGTGVVDIDGNRYTTIILGWQEWMVENLKATKFNDGSAIPLVIDTVPWSNLSTSGYCWLYNDFSYKIIFGALYNWQTVNTGKLSPTGWHVPSDTDWQNLINYLGGNFFAGGKMKESGTSHWLSPNSDATNESGFTGLPGLYRHYVGIFFWTPGHSGYWWSTTSLDNEEAHFVCLGYGGSSIWISHIEKRYGFSVRCLKN